MKQEEIDRINFLARKQKTEGLTEEEKAEQAVLRRKYIDAYKNSLIAQLENTYYIDAHGRKRKVTERKSDKS